MKTYTKTKFFEEYGHRFAKVKNDDSETGDYMLYCPEEIEEAVNFKKRGFEVASVYDECGIKEDTVVLNNDPSDAFHKYGFLIIEPE